MQVNWSYKIIYFLRISTEIEFTGLALYELKPGFPLKFQKKKSSVTKQKSSVNFLKLFLSTRMNSSLNSSVEIYSNLKL